MLRDGRDTGLDWDDDIEEHRDDALRVRLRRKLRRYRSYRVEFTALRKSPAGDVIAQCTIHLELRLIEELVGSRLLRE